MKKDKPFRESFYHSLKKTLLIMRNATFLLILGVLQAYAVDTYSQKTRLSLDYSDTELNKVLDNIEEESEFFFLYNEKLLDSDRKVNISANDQLINVILDNLFAGTDVKYSIIDRKIILAPEFLTQISNLQQKQVSGIVTDKNGTPLPGVNVIVTGTTIGDITNTEGSYRLEVPQGTRSLTFSFIGMEQQEVVLGTSSIINVTMLESSIGLEEVVVIGYGTQKKVNLTGSISSINFEKEFIKSRALTNVSTAISGMASGTFITQSNGMPSGGAATIRIRGTGSLNSSQAPLVIIDGQVGDMNSIAPNDVADISILKDAASSAIYGSRASNGVILITTKSGSDSENKITFNYDTYAGISSPTQTHDLVSNTADHMGLVNLTQVNSGFAAPFTQAQIDEWSEKSKTDPIGYPNTDWWKAIIKPNVVQNHNLSARGGNKKVNFYTSVNYYNNDGLINNTAYKRFTFRNNLSYKVTDWLELGNILTLLSGNAEPGSLDNIFLWWRATTPGMVPKHPDGRYGASQTPANEFQSNNPVHSVENVLGERNTRNYTAKLYAILTPLKGLKINGSYFMDRTDYDGWTSGRPADRWNFQTETIVFNNTSGAILSVSNFYNKSERTVIDLYADYNLTIDNHAIHLLAGYNQEYYKYTTFSGSKNELLSLDIPVLSAATGVPQVAGSGTDYAIRSFFGRINYSFKDKYLLESNIRYDGSSRFASDKRWGLFPSFSLGWRISQEDFWSGIKNAINDFKIRASWGQLGNNGIGNYDWQNYYLSTGYSFNGTAVPAIAYTSIANDEITWETTNVFNIGIDLKLFEKLYASLDYYDKYTKGILANLPIPYVNGGITAPRVNSAELRNSGIEAEVRYNTNIGDLFITMGMMGSYNKNKIVKYKGDYLEPHGIGIWTEGYPIDVFYLRKIDYILRDQSVVDALLADGWTFKPSTPGVGDFMYANTNDDKVIDDNDRVLMGNPIPLFTYNANISLEYKGFDFYLLLDGVAKWDKFLQGDLYSLNHIVSGYLWPKSYLNATWTEQNPNASIPRVYSNNTKNNQVSDFFLQKADYLKFKTIQLGYTIPSTLTQVLKLNKVRAYVNLENYFIITPYPGQDPENSEQTYPSMKTLSFGLNLSF